MARINIAGKAHYTDGCLPSVGQTLPRFTLTDGHWNEVSLQSYGELCKLIEVFPTVHAPGVAAHLRKLESTLHQQPRGLLIVVSNDLPSTLQRWHHAEKLGSVVVLSAYRSERFAQSCGVAINSGRYRGLTARASFIVDGQGVVLHAHLVRELGSALQAVEPTVSAATPTVRDASSVTVTPDTAVTV
jgi:thioredoxin-dependent peroxiredoxin